MGLFSNVLSKADILPRSMLYICDWTFGIQQCFIFR